MIWKINDLNNTFSCDYCEDNRCILTALMHKK
mgnify:CR=1 FL=1